MTAWLMTWLWQGSALAVGVAVTLRCTPGLNAATRHFVWCGALIGLAWLGWGSSPAPLAVAPLQFEPVLYVPAAPDVLISTIVGIWMSVALIGLVRLLPSLRAVFALRDRCVPFPVDIESRLPLWLEAKQKGRRTELMICDELPGATVLGLQRPCIALPRALLEALTIDDLDQVILHEHAHVQRRDDWLRLVQTLLLSALWVHPAALFVSRALNREREMACDEWVVARTGSPKAYARCLARAAEVRGRMKAQSALAPALFGTRHDLMRRVDRLLKLKGQARRNVSLAGALAAALALVVSSVHLQELRFAEIADVVLPSVARPNIAVDDEVTTALTELPADLEIRSKTVGLNADATPHTAYDARSEPNESAAPIAHDAAAASAFSALVTSSAPVAPTAPIAPSVAFAGVYPVPDAPVASSADAPIRWSALGTPGVEIASAAKKTSVGVANVFSRAGVSLARSF
jgi:bla regulator protein blaR1